jgi:hypothetical protein
MIAKKTKSAKVKAVAQHSLWRAVYRWCWDLESAVRSTRCVLRLANNRSTRTSDGDWLSGFDNGCRMFGALVRVGAR